MTTTLYCPVPYSGVISQGYTITQAGTAVPDNLVQAIISAAYTAGVVLTTSAGGTPAVVQSTSWFNAGTGAPTSGAWSAGMEVRDSTGAEFVCTASGSPGTWVPLGGGTSVPAKSLVLHLVKDYGADPTGVADATSALDSAVTDAIAALTSSANAVEIVFPIGTTLLSPTGTARFGVNLPPNLGGTLIFRGLSRRGSVVKLSTKCPSFIGPNTTPGTGAGFVFGDFAVRDLTIDGSSLVNPTFKGVVLEYDTLDLNIARITVERVDTINIGAPVWSGTIRRNITLMSNRSAFGAGVTQTTVTDIRVLDCFFGRSGGGGNTGVLVGGFLNQGLSGTYPGASALTNLPLANVFVDRVWIERNTWLSGITSYAGKAAAYEGVGIEVGAGRFARIRDNYLVGSTDDCIEINGLTDCVVEGNYTEDSMSEGVYIRPNPNGGGGSTDQTHARVLIKDHRHTHNLVAGSALASIPTALLIHSKDWGLVGGNITVDNLSVVSSGTNVLFAGGTSAVKVLGGFHSVNISKVRATMVGWTYSGSSNQAIRLVEMDLSVGRGSAELSDVSGIVQGSVTGTGVVSFWGCQVNTLADYRLKIDGIHPKWNMSRTGTGTVNTHDLEVNGTNVQTTSDPFSAATNLIKSYRADAGALSDMAVSGGVLTSAANPTVEKRLTWIQNDVDYGNGQVGPTSDGVVSAKFVPPTTPAAGYKAGLRLKVDPSTGLNSLHCWVSYDGTNYSVNVAPEQAGTVGATTSTVIGASVTSPFWVRASVIGNTVTADYCTSAVATRGTLPVATATATLTLTGSLITAFGPNAAQGYPGVVWVPQDTGSTVDDLTKWHTSSGTITAMRVGAREIVTAGATCTGISFGATLASNARVPKRWIFQDCDFSQYASNGITEFSGTDATTKGLYVARDIGYVTTPASATITLTGSPFTYVNQDGYTEDVGIYSGTVSSVTVQRFGQAAASQVAAATNVVVRLDPGDTLVVTYSVGPTLHKVPVL